MEKRQLTLADLLASSPHLDVVTERDVVLRLQARVRTAHKFVFDAEASRRAAEVIRDVPDLLAREVGFGLEPFGQDDPLIFRIERITSSSP